MKRILTIFFLSICSVPFVQGQQVVFSSNFDDLGSIIHEKFYTDSSLTSGGWTTQDVTGAQSWSIGNFTSSNPYAEINGYSGGANANEDWLISPSLDASQGLYLEFINAKNFTGPDMELCVSADYDGTSAPSTASWDTLNYNRSTGSFDWVNSGSIDLTSYTDTDFYIAFVYNSTNSNAAHWEVDDIRISTMPLKWFGSKTSIEPDSLSTFTSGPQFGNHGVKLINTEQSHRRLTTKPLMVDSGKTYEVTYWVRGDGSARAGIFDNDTMDGDFGFSYASWNSITSGSTWEQKTQTVTADTTNANAEFILSVNYTYASQHVQFDSVVVTKQDTSSSIADHQEAPKQLEVFPNPSSEHLFVKSQGYGMDLSVELLDATGRLVRTRSSEMATRFRFHVQELDPGIYFIRLRNGEEMAQKKVLVR